jgi:hypothetical protein
MIFFNKKPGLSDEFFHEHWKSVHADLTMQVGGMGRRKGGVVRYVQVRYSTFFPEDLRVWGVWRCIILMVDGIGLSEGADTDVVPPNARTYQGTGAAARSEWWHDEDEWVGWGSGGLGGERGGLCGVYEGGVWGEGIGW